MAGNDRLSRATRHRLLVLAAAVLAAHALLLHLFTRWQPQGRLLRPMTAPLYTRVLEPAAPAPVQAVPAAPPAVPAGRLQAARAIAPPAAPAAPAPQPRADDPAAAPPPQQEDRAPAQAVDVAGAGDAAATEPAAQATDPPAEPPAGAAAAPAPAEAGTPASTGAPAALADSWPADTRLRYRLGGRFRGGELYGSARVLWQREGERYQVRVEVDVTLLASLVMTSQGEVRPGGLLPQVYEEVRRGGVRGVRMGERDITLANGGVVRRPPGVQDTASQFVELTHRFATGQASLQVGQSVSFWMARPGQVDLWTYDVLQREVLRTRLGELEAFHLKPRPIATPRGNITAEMWFAPSLQYLPVRIQVHMGDEAMIDLLVEAIEQR